MALELPPVETIRTLWDWTRQNLDLWARTFGSLRGTPEGRDLDGAETLIAALQFSFFAIFLALLVELPIAALIWPGWMAPTRLLALAAEHYIQIVVVALCQRAVAFALRGGGSLRACLVATLFGTAYWPLVNLSDYAVLADPGSGTALIGCDFSRDTAPRLLRMPRIVTLLAVDLGLLAFLLTRFIPAIRLVHGVGAVRGALSAA